MHSSFKLTATAIYDNAAFLLLTLYMKLPNLYLKMVLNLV